MQKMDEILDYHPEDFDVCVRPGVTREGEREHPNWHEFRKQKNGHL